MQACVDAVLGVPCNSAAGGHSCLRWHQQQLGRTWLSFPELRTLAVWYVASHAVWQQRHCAQVSVSFICYYSRRRQLRGEGVPWRLSVCQSVCFPHDMSETDASRITKRDVDMVHNEPWKPVYFRVKRSKIRSRGTKNIASMGRVARVSAGFF